ncbi:aspartate kinase [Salsuginibacillus halophilus]|uniref:Aspartokinase n=1 Tax=Salsuginibacillus halophilus TaxID=517424 RepID=A0A2P8HX63_9BACI|nr:aspartate kinase [Salsuginibacillus halophilus]PSL50802.1 aspartate kinase [Salsuginibacillus halophilus]
MRVAKFGGSSLASAEQIKKVTNIVQEHPERRLLVVSAPGKRDSGDTKVTDLLIELGSKAWHGQSYEAVYETVVDRYRQIASGLGLGESVVQEVAADFTERVQFAADNEESYMDQMKAGGEDNNAKVIARYLQNEGVKAAYLNPYEAGLLVSDEPGNAKVLPEAYEHLYKLRDRDEILVFPGFFGYTPEGKLATFPRGGSDITGSIVAAGVQADLYENFTDVDSVYAANPGVVDQPMEVKQMTYREMRELSYAGFGVFHDEALIPAFRASIPVCVKNTNNPDAEGTMIIAERAQDQTPVTGIAADEGFSTIYVRKYLMNREVGFGRRLLKIVEDEGISYEHIPSGIDDTSVIIDNSQLTAEKEERMLTRIMEELEADDAHIEHGFAMIMLVGEGMHETVGVASRAAQALSNRGINIEMINQGSSEVSLTFGIQAAQADEAIRGLYEQFFRPSVVGTES